MDMVKYLILFMISIGWVYSECDRKTEQIVLKASVWQMNRITSVPTMAMFIIIIVKWSCEEGSRLSAFKHDYHVDT